MVINKIDTLVKGGCLMLFGLKKKLATLFFMAVGAGILTTLYTSILFLYVYKIDKKVNKLIKR